MNAISIGFKMAKETKGTWVYEETPEGQMPPKIGMLYVRKWALGEKPPKAITVTIAEQ